MKSFKQFIHEARRNPEKNPKVGATEYLRKYKDRDDIYISFTEVNKIGINPKTFEKYDTTPAGVYAYPLKQFWDYYFVALKGNVKMAAPFAGNKPYIQILKGKHTKGFIKDFSKYTERDLEKDIQKIFSYFEDERIRKAVYEFVMKGALKIASTPIEKFWYITSTLTRSKKSRKELQLRSNKFVFAWTELLRKLGYTGFSDTKGTKMIHESEPIQTVFLDPREYEQIDMIENKEYGQRDYQDGGTWDGNLRGVWYDGTWKDGTWKDGIWKDGIWKDGCWCKGKWENGKWFGGTWNDGNWEDGTWKSGTWKDGTWCNGYWENGTWCDGYWQTGYWENGTWYNGTWGSGEWNNGTWKDGKWKGGIWKGGTWECGLIRSNKFYGEICSSVDPQTFCQYQNNSSSLEELESKVK